MTDFDPAIAEPMPLQWLDRETQPALLAATLADDDWTAEQKFDGVRCMVRVTADGQVRFVSRGGRALVQAAAALHFPVLREAFAPLVERGLEVLLDGELDSRSGHLWLFDQVWERDTRLGAETVLPDDWCISRYGSLLVLVDWLQTTSPAGRFHLRVVPRAFFEADKRALLEAASAQGAEGVVLKRGNSRYLTDGTRSDDWLKVKVYRTADCVVTGRNVGQGENVRGQLTRTKNATLGLFDDVGALVDVGQTSMIGKPDAQVGDVLEVRYLSWEPGGRLVQPCALTLRPDRVAAECTLTQLVPVSRDSLMTGFAP